MAKNKFYAVKKGFKPGIYKTWDECKAQTDGYACAEYRGFKTEDEAKAFLGLKEIKTNNQNYDAVYYTDGSHDKLTDNIGYGFLCLVNDKVIFKQFGPAKQSKTLNIAGEIKAVLMAVRHAGINRYKKIKICHDYIGIRAWQNGEWRCKTKESAEYISCLHKMLDNFHIELDFEKVTAHTGNKYNEEADRLARLGTTVNSSQVERCF